MRFKWANFIYALAIASGLLEGFRSDQPASNIAGRFVDTKEKFVSAYDAKHTIEMEGDGTRTLIAGNDVGPSQFRL